MTSSHVITEIKTAPGQGAYYYEDVSALQARSIPESERWHTAATAPGMMFVRELVEVVSIGIKNQDNFTSWGDCVGVSYAGKSGREGPFRSSSGISEIRDKLAPFLFGREIKSFRQTMREIRTLQLSNAVEYGVSQSLLQAVANSRREDMWRTICREWSLPSDDLKLVPIQGSSGNNRMINADKMIVNRLAGLPHGQIDDIPTQLGPRGEILLDYARWLRHRVEQLGGTDFRPVIHLDVHGAVGKIFDQDPVKIANYVKQLEIVLSPYHLRMESIALGATRDETIALLLQVQNEFRALGLNTALVADEWANSLNDITAFSRSGAVQMIHIKTPNLGGLDETIDAVLALKKLGISQLLGGSCVETDLSARATVHVALATQPTALLAKPGMGIDEAIMIMRNEMARSLC